MNKISWKWFVLIGTVFAPFFYSAITNEHYLEMRQMSLGQPDPAFFPIMGLILAFSGFFMSVAILQNLSTEIATEVGGFCVHSLDPVGIIDPIEMCSKSEEAKAELRLSVRDSFKYKFYLSNEYITEICEVMEWKGSEIDVFLKEYMKSVDFWKPIGLWPDGGLMKLGFHGFRWWIGGTSLLAAPLDLVIDTGDGAVCVASLKNYNDIEQLQGLPKWLQRGTVKVFPQFIPGKHMVSFGNRSHPIAVRAMVERNRFAPDDELVERPRWIWTLGLKVKEINPKARMKLLEDTESALRKEARENEEKLDTWEKRHLRETRGIAEQPIEEEENDKEA